MTSETARRAVLQATAEVRAKAEVLLRDLIEARDACDRVLREHNRVDALRRVTGSSALDNAISHASRMIETLDRAESQARRAMAQDDPARAEDDQPADDSGPGGLSVHIRRNSGVHGRA